MKKRFEGRLGEDLLFDDFKPFIKENSIFVPVAAECYYVGEDGRSLGHATEWGYETEITYHEVMGVLVEDVIATRNTVNELIDNGLKGSDEYNLQYKAYIDGVKAVINIAKKEYSKNDSKVNFDEKVKETKTDEEADRDNFEMMLAYFDISEEQYNNVDHDNIKQIVDSKWKYQDAKRILWHEFRENAFTKKGQLLKRLEKKLRHLSNNSNDSTEQPGKTREKASAGKQKALDNAAKARSTAKVFGGKALIGSAKQKSWGEALRKEFIEKTSDDAILDKVINNKSAQKAKFWIELRNCQYNEIADILLGRKKLSIISEREQERARLLKISKPSREHPYFKKQILDFERKYNTKL